MEIPDAHRILLEKRRKGRRPQSYYREVPSRQVKLKISNKVWVKALKGKLSYELIPSAYLEIMRRDDNTPFSYTDGSAVVTAVKSSSQNTITITDMQKCTISAKEAKKSGFEWLSPSHTLFLDRNHHFLKRLKERDFDVSLMIDAYIELKRVMPGDCVSVTDGHTKILGRKQTGLSIVLNTGVVLGEMDWNDFLDVKFY